MEKRGEGMVEEEDGEGDEEGRGEYLAKLISPPSRGVLITRQKTALSISGFSIISSFRESLKFCKCEGKAFVNAVAYKLVNNALCLSSTSSDTANPTKRINNRIGRRGVLL